MDETEFEKSLNTPPSHPHVLTLQIDPADHRRLERMIEDRRDLRLLKLEDQQPDLWTVYIGCASRRVRDELAEMSERL